MEFNLRTHNFTVPSGYSVTIREQNGQDEETITNPVDAKDLMNLTKFISAIVVKTDFTTNGKLTLQDALNMPLLDRYCILFQSRIFSLGEIINFAHTWEDNGSNVEYEEDLSNFIFDYGTLPTQEELEAKPDAIPYYPVRSSETNRAQYQYEYQLKSGKVIMFHLLTGAGERKMLTTSPEKVNRNLGLLARDLMLMVDGKYEKVENFSLFSAKDMAEIHHRVNEVDPSFAGDTEIENPYTGAKKRFPVMAAPDFFFLTGDTL